ncbi:MAG: hypothetical protein AAB281_02755 [Actinomycetota bacterium]
MKPTTLKTAITLTLGTLAALTLPAGPAAATGPATACEIAHPISMVATEHAGQNVPTNRTMTVTFIGPIANADKLKPGGKQKIMVCEGSPLQYRTESTVGSVSCTLDKKPMPPQGAIKVDASVQRFVCTNKPDGSDVDQFQIVGVNR